MAGLRDGQGGVGAITPWSGYQLCVRVCCWKGGGVELISVGNLMLQGKHI